jgi:hypothetical protein
LRIDRVDILGAIVMDSKPRFELVSPALYPGHEDLGPYNRLAARYKIKLSNLTGLQDLSQEMMEVYCILRHLITEKEKVAGSLGMEITEAEFLSLQSYCTQLMHRLIALIQYKAPDSLNQNALIYKLFGQAAVAHIVMFTYNAPPRAGIPALMSMRIRTSLEIIRVRDFHVAYPEMMLWIIMIGGFGSIGTEDQGWFIKFLAASCHAAGIVGVNELALSLTEFLWSEFYLGPIFNGFWNNFAVAQAVEAANEIGDRQLVNLI